MTFTNTIVTDPFDFEVEPGKTVRQLATREECQRAVFKLDMDYESIQAQIARAEAEPALAEPGWRTRAQSAIRWKKRVKTAIVEYAKRFDPPRPPEAKRYAALLDVLREELGQDQFEALLEKARRRHPLAFAEVS